MFGHLVKTVALAGLVEATLLPRRFTSTHADPPVEPMELATTSNQVVAATWRIKVYYVNLDSSTERKACAQGQLEELQTTAGDYDLVVDFERFPAVEFHECTDAASCIEERPKCFPMNKTGYVHHGLTQHLEGEAKTHMVRGVLGNWCSHLWLIGKLRDEAASYNYFLVLEDDVILHQDFAKSLSELFNAHPHHWDMIAIDTFAGSGPNDGSLPSDDRFKHGEKVDHLPLYTLSQSMNSYWGAHAWLLSSQTVSQFYKFMSHLPAVPLDWVPKATRPLHVGIWAYQPGTVMQRENAPQDLVDRLDSKCAAEKGSDIAWSPLLKQALSSKMSSGIPREIVVLGMHESGTKLMVDLIERNLAKPNDMNLCRNYSSWAFCGQVWKHTHPSNLDAVEKLRQNAGFGNFSEVVAVVVVRHPFAQLRSMQTRMGDVDCKAGGSEVHQFDKPCRYHEPSFFEANSVRSKRAMCTPRGAEVGACWASMTEAWNSYVTAYGRLVNAGVFAKVVIVRYEDIMESPIPLLRRIAHFANLRVAPQPTEVPLFQETPLGFDVAGRQTHEAVLSKLGTNDYGLKLKCSELNTLCNGLDRSVMSLYGYRGCEKVWSGFDELIFNGDKYISVNQVSQLLSIEPQRVCVN